MSDPIMDYLSSFSVDQLCEIATRIEAVAARRRTEMEEEQKRKVLADQQPAQSTFRVPKIPSAGKVEDLASSLDLDISQLMKEVKAWSR
ncbi:hypothetical protein [Nitrincola alkalilacustris]|uniref:hypothetical protein n=1 Tax=Nitrincola alkalilacustris TaxID=1571224 RepID=UPI00124EA2AF|nr:hypothetical protein [Nitrincola alkalilacustris]